jgi:hypothetical protein
MFYNAHLLEIPQKLDLQNHLKAFGWADDVNFITRGLHTEETTSFLATAYALCDKWALTHGSKFDPAKFHMVHFFKPPTRKETTIRDNQILNLGGQIITAEPHARVLGVLLDTNLNFTAHTAEILAKADRTLNVIPQLGKSTLGTGLVDSRNVYQATVLPYLLKGSSLGTFQTTE